MTFAELKVKLEASLYPILFLKFYINTSIRRNFWSTLNLSHLKQALILSRDLKIQLIQGKLVIRENLSQHVKEVFSMSDEEIKVTNLLNY